MPPVQGPKAPVAGGNPPPRRSRPGPPQDPVDHLPVIVPPTSPTRRPVRQQRLQSRPLCISQIVTIEHKTGPPGGRSRSVRHALVALTAEEYEPVMLFLNHSCEPNVGFGGNIVLVAMRDIAAGEELTTDYALFDDYDGEMTCSCRTARCRGVIGGRDWRLPELQRRY